MSSALITVMPTTLKLTATPETIEIIDPKIREKISHLLEEAAKIIVIENDQVNNEAALVRRELREYWKQIEGSRKELKKPLDKNVKALQKFAKGFQDPIDVAINDLEGKQSAFAQKRQDEIDEQRRKADEEEARRQEEAAAAAAAGEPVPEVEPVVSAEVGEAKTDFGSTKWKIVFEIVAPIKVPRELCTPNETLIREAIKMGELTIPDGMKEITEHGIRFFKEVKVVDHGR